MTAWVTRRWLALDTESTGVDVTADRIVTACAAIVETSPSGLTVVFEREWLIAVDVDIPAEATAVHGIETAHAREHGVPADVAVKEIANAVRYAVHSSTPLVIYNAPYDLSLLNAECARNGLGGLVEFCDRPIEPVIDPLCIDKGIDRYRKGKRTLTAAAEFYGVELKDAHAARADTIAAAGVAHRLAERADMDPEAILRLYGDRKYPKDMLRAFKALRSMSPTDLHTAQTQWYRQQSEGLGAYWRREAEQKRHDAAGADTDEQRDIALQEAAELDQRVDGLSDAWPLRPLVSQEATA